MNAQFKKAYSMQNKLNGTEAAASHLAGKLGAVAKSAPGDATEKAGAVAAKFIAVLGTKKAQK